MGRALRIVFLALVWAGFVSQSATGQRTLDASLAFVRNNSLTIAAKHGEVLDTVLMRPAVSDFAISPNRKLVVVVSRGTSHGGDLELIDLRVRKRTPYLSTPLHFSGLAPDQREVYADPQFSPDGQHLVFSVRKFSQSGANDASDAAGPLAVMEVATRQVHIVKSTTSVAGKGPCYTNTPLWSPDGSYILYSCESGFAITPTDGSSVRKLDAGTENRPWTAAIGWLGRRCVLYVQARDGASNDTEVRYLSLVTNQSQDARPLLTRQRAQIAGLLEASSDAAISRTSEVTIHSQSSVWVLPNDAPAHLLTSWSRADIPSGCR
jgi:hypothetical protein